MARILPDGWQALPATGGIQREIETLSCLEQALPDAYTVYHSVHWARLRQGSSVFGELDFVIVAPSGRLLLIEQKAGALTETVEGLSKVYASGPKNVASQISRSVSGLQFRLAGAFGPKGYRVEELLYCPDYRVLNPAIAGVSPERIVDARRRDQLSAIIQQILPLDEELLPCHEQIHAFLADTLSLMPDVSALAGAASNLVTQISDGLATWARAIRFEPFRLRVIGTAGSGKTQLALGVLRDAAQAGLSALYLSFNRPLADHVRAIAPPSAQVMTFHQLCLSVAREAGVTVDFSGKGVFEHLAHLFATHAVPEHFRCDVLIIDEGQDFLQSWVEPLARLLQRGGRWWWLEDPMQNLLGRPAIALPGWVEVHAATNYRSPADILRFIGRLAGPTFAVHSACPFVESGIGFYAYPDGGVAQATKEALAEAREAGFSPAEIALLSFRGRDSSWIAGLDRLGSYSLRSFTGAYDATGNPVFREGQLLFESIFRFKGQCAPCVILTEVDFAEFDDNVLRRLFVGVTRATLKLIIVASERAAQQMIGRA